MSERHRRPTLGRPSGLLAFLAISLSFGCTYSMPLGGASLGRGGPVGKGVLELGVSAGSFPELSGTVPEVADSSGHVVNPIPGRDALGSGGRVFDLAGVVIGLSDRADVGLSLSRGLHGTIRLKDGGVWSVSASPSLFWYRSEDYAARASVTNLGLFGTIAVDPWPGGRRFSEAYVASGINWYRASLETNAATATDRNEAYSVAAGLRLGGPWPTDEYGDLGVSLSAEVGKVRIRQRDGRRLGTLGAPVLLVPIRGSGRVGSAARGSSLLRLGHVDRQLRHETFGRTPPSVRLHSQILRGMCLAGGQPVLIRVYHRLPEDSEGEKRPTLIHLSAISDGPEAVGFLRPVATSEGEWEGIPILAIEELTRMAEPGRAALHSLHQSGEVKVIRARLRRGS